MKTGLPTQIDAERYAREGRSIEGFIPQAVLPRLKDLLGDINNQIKTNLSFAVNGQGHIVIDGQIDTTVVLECQRTLELFDYPVKTSFKLVVVKDDRQADSLSPEYEPFLMDDNGYVSPLEMVEEEIILSLPLVAKKELKDCDLNENKAYYGNFEEDNKSLMRRPFADLKAMIKQ